MTYILMTLTLPDTGDIFNWNWKFAELFPWTLNLQVRWNRAKMRCLLYAILDSFKLQINIFCKKHSVQDKKFHLNSVWSNQDMKILLQLINEYSNPSLLFTLNFMSQKLEQYLRSWASSLSPALVFSCARQLVKI